MKVSRQQIVLVVFIAGLAVAGYYGFIAYNTYIKPVFNADFEGQALSFRVDLREAQKVELTPDDATVSEMVNAVPRNVTIAFRNVTQQVNGWYSLEGTEIIVKLTALYKVRHGADVGFNAVQVSDYESLRGGDGILIIALVHPEIAEETSVRADRERNVITISGGDRLRDFDYATAKFLMASLGISV